MVVNLQSKKRWTRLTILVVLLQGVLLFAIIPRLSGPLHTSYNENLIADGYDQLADSLDAGQGYRFYPDTAKTLMREPGYPILLAGLRLCFGRGMASVKIANMILALATAWLTLLIARRLIPEAHHSFAVLAAAPLLYLFSPGTLVAESRGGVEILFGFLIAVFILTIYRLIASNRFLDFVISGIVLGVIVLVRSTPMLFPVFLLIYLLFFEKRSISRFAICRNVAALVIAMLAILSPWIVRNYSLTGKFVPTASVMGVSAQAGQYINTHLFEGRPWWLLDREASRQRDKVAAQLGYPFEDGPQGYYQTFYQSGDEIKFSNYLFHRVVTNYWDSPALFARCIAQNALNFWFAGKTWSATAINAAVQLPYLILAGMGIVYCLKNRRIRLAGPIVLFITYIWAVHAPILAQARYSIPLIPLVSSLGAIGLVAVRSRSADSATMSKRFVISGT
jgi:4-amino-4-deoxy-L-arabinose transferase-like glycosyltransferase